MKTATNKEDLFQDRYDNLNDRQRDAVDTIYGAVMVIAGPGTGKTEVLAMRIANLLRSDAQVQPQEVLCLTYTDEATNSMRRRLVQITGPAAHKVNIHTFHGFCNMVIQANPDYFSRREMQPLDDLEKAEILHQMLEELPQGHLLRRLSGELYYDTKRLVKLFDMMKQEHLTPTLISTAIDEYLTDLPNREVYIYKVNSKNNKKGDLKQSKIDDEKRKMEITRAAAALFTNYQELMRAAARYDYHDMILWVLDAFSKHPVLLQSYQERYQYILVDEFQDTNGAQNELLKYMTSYWDNPNVFVVGDDDQSIYEFQGARIRNIIDFYDRHSTDIKVIVLPQNYRSSQAVIDRAMATIQHNKQRLINQLHSLQLDKNIVAANHRFLDGKDTVEPEIRVYHNILHEEAHIVMQIEALRDKGVPLRDIAVLYAQHKQADNIIALMERKGIAYNLKKEVNILADPLITQLLNVLRYLDAERKKTFDGEELLFELMHAPYFGIAPNDIAQLALYMQQQRKEKGAIRWRMALSNPLMIEALNLPTASHMHRLGRNLDHWEQQQLAMPLPLLVEKIIHESGIIANVLKTAQHLNTIQLIHTFFSFVSDVYARNIRMRIPEFLRMIERMETESITLPMQRVVQSENGVYFYTAHGAKGNEFEYVFLIGCTTGFWEKKKSGMGTFSLPDTLTATTDDVDSSYKVEVARRLYYVALTRARKHLYISYALNDNNGKGLEPSAFIDEIAHADGTNRIVLSTEQILKHIEWALTPVPDVRIRTTNAQWIDRNLQQFVMSATQLNKFLRCPLSFYYETILRVPFQKSDALSFGTAIHYALERLYLDRKLHDGTFPPKENVIAAFKSEMYRELASFTHIQFERRMEQGETILSDYYDHYLPTLHTQVEIEFKIPRYQLDGVPVTGKIDKIEMHGDTCTVIDYKTGNAEKSASKYLAPPNEKDPLGGEYWRQMVFYKLIIENYDDRNWHVNTGKFDYVQKTDKGEFKQYTVPVFEADEQIVRHQLKDAYTRIMNHEFDKGCGDENCHWCNFAKRYQLIRTDDDTEMDDDE